MGKINRREFLKLAGSAACAVALGPVMDVTRVLAAQAEPEGLWTWPPASLGRTVTWGVRVHTRPNPNSKVIRVVTRDQILPLDAQVIGEAVTPHNLLWYKTDNGFVHSALVQPVENILNPAEPERAAEQFWGEVTVPYSDSRVAPDPRARLFFRLYYTSVFRVVAAALDQDGQWWYRLQDGITWGPGPYVPAAHIRRIDPTELTPLSPEAMNKRIEVDLETQFIVAYEGDQPVMVSRVASGFGDFATPRGRYTVLCKSLTSRMTGGQGDDFYDLPGVPFPTYFTEKRAGIHGTYWHNDYGRPRSHGCLNVPSPVARWFWRWTLPVAPYEERTYETPGKMKGTEIVIA